MEKMFLKRNPLVFFLILLLFLIGAGFFSYVFFLPRYIEKKILPDLGRQLSGSLTGQIYRVGFSAADFGNIIFGDTQNPVVSIGSVHAEYSLPDLLTKKLGLVRINGLTLHLEVSNGQLIIPGFELESLRSSQGANPGLLQPTAVNLPITLDSFQVKNGLLSILYEGENLLIPFDLQISRNTKEDSLSVYYLTLQMMPLGEEITLTGTIDLTGNKSIMSLVAGSLDLDRFERLTGAGRYDLHLGRASIMGKAEIRLVPLQLLSAKLTVDPELVHYGKTGVLFGQNTPDAGPAINLELEREQDKFLVKAQSYVREPLGASLELNGSAIMGENSVQGSGNIVLRTTEPPGKGTGDQPFFSLILAPELHGDVNFALDKSRMWKTEFISPGQKQPGNQPRVIEVQYDKIRLQTAIPSLVVKGQGTAAAYEVQVSLAIPKVKAGYDGAEINMPEASMQAIYKQNEDAGHGKITGTTFSIALKGTKFQEKGLNGKADIFVQGEMGSRLADANTPLQAEGIITVVNAEITESASQVSLDALEGNIPWSWPQAPRKMAGKIKASQIGWKDVDLGSFKGDIALNEMMYTLDGNYSSNLFKGVAAKISGKAGIAGSTYIGELALQSDMTPFAAINLGKFDRSLDKSYFSGELGFNTFFKLEAGDVKGRMQVNLRNGTYDFPEKKYNIKGIDFSMFLPALPDLHTAPAQTIHFDEASIGNLAFSKGKLVWQLESTASVFLEEGVVGWAGGRVFTNAVRISPEMNEFVVPIFCDRLKLAELLRQFGVSNAEGEGTVNGRIPLRVGKKSIRFEDGFLYSSPGQGGSVKVAAFDLLAAGIPKNTPQFAQVDFAAEALKNFQYNWVRLLLNTEGEDLVMQMQMDGKPLQSLPFIYDNQTGILQRADGTKQGINQPIRLDVNFRLPLNRFLGYSGKIQDILKKIK